MSLVKASAWSLIILLGILFCVHTKKMWLIILLSFIYVWSYGGWPLALVVVFIFICADMFLHGIKRAYADENIFLLISVIVGLGLGLVLSPYFPQNLSFYYTQIVDIAMINQQTIIPVGMEWYPPIMSVWVIQNIWLLVLFVVACASTLLTRRKQNVFSLSLMILAFLLFILALKSQRNIEYFAPIAIIASAYALHVAEVPQKVFEFYKKIHKKTIRVMFITFLCIASGLLIASITGSVKGVFIAHQKTYAYSLYQNAAYYLETHTEDNEIVYHSSWDEFPILWYHNDKNRYIAGLDPTFFYRKNPESYMKWLDITRAKTCEGIKEHVQSLDARYVFIALDHEGMRNCIEGDLSFTLVYHDDSAWIYKLID